MAHEISRIAQVFASRNNAAFIPFFTVGDPDLETTGLLVREAAKRGADLIELGVPFSDPIADGPTIEASYHRALANGFKVDQLFTLVKELREDRMTVPILCMVSQSLVYKRGLDAFLDTCREAGIDGILIPDLPAGYEGDLVAKAKERNLDAVFLSAPTTTPERRRRIARSARGFIYYISVAGITGIRDRLPEDLENNVTELKRLTKTPVCVGFGIGSPEQAAAVSRIADGVIVGSALVREIKALRDEGLNGKKLVKKMGETIAALAEATHAYEKPVTLEAQS